MGKLFSQANLQKIIVKFGKPGIYFWHAFAYRQLLLKVMICDQHTFCASKQLPSLSPITTFDTTEQTFHLPSYPNCPRQQSTYKLVCPPAFQYTQKPQDQQKSSCPSTVGYKAL